MQLSVGEVVLGRGEPAAGLVDAGKRGGRERLALFERLRRERAGAAQAEIALVVGLGTRIVGIGRGEGRAHCRPPDDSRRGRAGRSGRLLTAAPTSTVRAVTLPATRKPSVLSMRERPCRPARRLAALLVVDFDDPGRRTVGRFAEARDALAGIQEKAAKPAVARAPAPTTIARVFRGSLVEAEPTGLAWLTVFPRFTMFIMHMNKVK